MEILEKRQKSWSLLDPRNEFPRGFFIVYVSETWNWKKPAIWKCRRVKERKGACCRPRACDESDTSQQLDNSNNRQDCPPLSDANWKLKFYLHFWPTGYKTEVSIPLSLGLINSREGLIGLKNRVYSLGCQFTTQQPDKEIHRVRSPTEQLRS